jgi:spore coat protein CotH
MIVGMFINPVAEVPPFQRVHSPKPILIRRPTQGEADYSDILALYQVLHDETRSSDPDVWRSNLEAIFNVNGFLRYLAVNSVIQNWDTYGVMWHNYYLYHDPENE